MSTPPEHTIVGIICNIYRTGAKYTIVSIRTNQRPRPTPRRPSDTPKVKKIRCKLPSNNAYTIGQLIEVTGQYESYKGNQLVASSVRTIERGTKEYAIHYLASEWMGILEPSEARRTVEQLGINAVAELLESPEIIHDIKGLLKARKQNIHDALQGGKETFRTLYALDKIHVPYQIAQEAYQLWKDAAVDTITKYPHSLIELDTEWEDIDNVRQTLQIPHLSPQHLNTLIAEAFRRASQDGHTYLPEEQLRNYIQNIIGHQQLSLAKALRSMTSSGFLISPSKGCYATPRLHRAERKIASYIMDLAQRQIPTHTSESLNSMLSTLNLPHALTDEQTTAVHTALTSGFSVITGGPGVGKTLTLQAITKAAEALNLSPILMAPTGKAAQLLANITGRKATTIHVALRPIKNGWYFNERNTLPTQLVIIDEASMIDTYLTRAVLAALPPQARIVLVGDANQLPSVGPGNILSDIINSDSVPVAKLTKAHRQSKETNISAVAEQMLQGTLLNLPESSEVNGKNVTLVTKTEPNEIYSSIRLLIDSLSRCGIPRDDVQVLSPTRQGVLGTEQLNEELKPHQRNGFWEGDRVVQTKNNYNKNVVNGDSGRVIERGTKGHTDYVVADFGHTQATYTEHTWHELSHAYALTVHRSQGSEYGAVIIVLHPNMLSAQVERKQIVSRSLIYTAITRAKKCAIIISTLETLEHALQMDNETRYTQLCHFLRG